MAINTFGSRANTTKLGGWTLVDFTTVGANTWSIPSGVASINAMLISGGGGGGGGGFSENSEEGGGRDATRR